MNLAKLTVAVSIACALAPWLPLAAAQEPASRDLAKAKSFFSAGAAAYEMGDYAAAIQALEAAYELTPLPAVAFSLAQAERRQYFVSHERARLERAIELYRTYLRAVETGGRRADATDALGQLEPLAALSAPSDDTSAESAEAARERTRLMITCAVPSAQVALDAAAPVAIPLIARVAPGTHRIVVSAPGYFPTERSVEAVPGELLPLEVSLREQPASVTVTASPESDLHVDGTFMGRAGSRRRFELSRGEHQLTLSKTGHEIARVKAELAPGEAREIAVDLATTTQRKWSIAMFVASGGALLVSGALTGIALDRERSAREIELERRMGNITPAQLSEYDETKRDRNRLRGVAATGFAVSLAGAVTGLLLYLLDEPDLREPRDAPALRVDVPVPGSPAASLTGAMRF
jgi:tetratricopeptide (TPR) repeat protein